MGKLKKAYKSAPAVLKNRGHDIVVSHYVLRAAKMIVGFEITSASRIRGREEIKLGIQGQAASKN